MLTVQIHLLLILSMLPYILDVLGAVGSSGMYVFVSLSWIDCARPMFLVVCLGYMLR